MKINTTGCDVKRNISNRWAGSAGKNIDCTGIDCSLIYSYLLTKEIIQSREWGRKTHEEDVWIRAGEAHNLVLSSFSSAYIPPHIQYITPLRERRDGGSIPPFLRVLLSDLPPPLIHASFDPSPSHTSIMCPSLSLLHYSLTSSLPLLPLPSSSPPPSLRLSLSVPSIWK